MSGKDYYVRLEHVVVLLLCNERLLEHGDVLLIVGVLLFNSLHLGLNQMFIFLVNC